MPARYYDSGPGTYARDREDVDSVLAYRSAAYQRLVARQHLSDLAYWFCDAAWATPNPDQSRPEPVSGEITNAH